MHRPQRRIEGPHNPPISAHMRYPELLLGEVAHLLSRKQRASSPSSLPPPRFRFGEKELLSDLAGESRRLSLRSRGVASRLGGLTLHVGLGSPPGLHILEMDKPRRVLRPASALPSDRARTCRPTNCAGRDADDCCCLGQSHPRRGIEGRASIVETDMDGLAGWALSGWSDLYRLGHSVPFREPRSYLVASATESDHHQRPAPYRHISASELGS